MTPIIFIALKIIFKAPGIIFGKNDISHQWKRACLILFLIVTFPVTPILLYIQKQLVKAKLNTLLGKYTGLLNEIKRLLKLKADIKKICQMYQQLTLGFEIVFQIAINLTLIAWVRSETRTTSGLESLFQGNNFFGTNGVFVLCISTFWSFRTFTAMYLRTYPCSKYFCKNSTRIVIIFYSLLSLSIRLLCIIMWFTPCLGADMILARQSRFDLGIYFWSKKSIG